jgi:hypothetical protein
VKGTSLTLPVPSACSRRGHNGSVETMLWSCRASGNGVSRQPPAAGIGHEGALQKGSCRGNLNSETVNTRPPILTPYCETGPASVSNKRSFCDWSRRVFGLVVGQCKQTLDRHLPCGRSLPQVRRDLVDVHDFSRRVDRPARLKLALRTEAESRNKRYGSQISVHRKPLK